MTGTKKETLDAVVAEIFQLEHPKIDKKREKQIADFIVSAVNGDMPVASLVINASVDKKNKGAIIYLLTNLRLIKVDIAPKEAKSSSYPLNTLIGVERKLINSDEIEFSVSFQNGAFGLRYSSELKNITDFFQKIESIEKL